MSHIGTTEIALLALLTSCLPLAQAADTQTFSSGESKTTMIELFTSEGCSSCPPADIWLSGLKSDPRLWQQIIPMSFHVDYWDYIGWRDRFASSDYSGRQRSHKEQGNIRSVYTPGFVVDGREWRGWFRGGDMQLASTGAQQLRLEVDGQSIDATYAGEGRPLLLNVALLGFDLSNQVSSGENAGKRLTHDFVVLKHTSKLSDNGRWQLELPAIQKSPVKTKAIAAWVSEPTSLRPLQAIGGWLMK